MMKPKIKTCLRVAVLVGGFSCGRACAIEESSFSKSLVPVNYILNAEEGSWAWGMAPIYDEKGTLHIFNSIIPKKGSWVKHSKIAHWTADQAEGPYTLLGDVLVSEDASYHNPQVSKVGSTYVLVFLLNRYSDDNGSRQEVGIATATSLDGPWTESPLNPVIPGSGRMDGANILHASNPTFVEAPDGKFRIYYKSMTDKSLGKPFREISLAVSDRIEGPYVNHPENPIISYADRQVDIEDPYAFYFKGIYYMLLEDRSGVANVLEGKVGKVKNGGWRPGLLYTSTDGIHWGEPEIGYQTNEFYFGDSLARSERPSILWKNGKPEYLFLSCHDDKPTAGYFLKIVGWE